MNPSDKKQYVVLYGLYDGVDCIWADKKWMCIW